MGRRAAKIAKVKGREDAKRGKTFARIGKKIIMVSCGSEQAMERGREEGRGGGMGRGSELEVVAGTAVSGCAIAVVLIGLMHACTSVI